MNPIVEQYVSPPHAGQFMLNAFLPSLGWKAVGRFPDLQVHWRDFNPLLTDLQIFLNQCNAGLPLEGNPLALLAPSIVGFRSIMVMLTHRAWPLPIWNALQIRNRFTLHRPIANSEQFELTVAVDNWRVLEKGLEVDLRSRLMQGTECAWDGLVTFYYRGHFGKDFLPGATSSALTELPDLSDAAPLHTWRTNGAHRWDFGRWTGDYNGIHQWDRYARMFGFAKAFAHPQRLVAQCLTQWPLTKKMPLQLDLWIRGPVAYDSEVRLRGYSNGFADVFALHTIEDPRPALVGRLASKVEQQLA